MATPQKKNVRLYSAAVSCRRLCGRCAVDGGWAPTLTVHMPLSLLLTPREPLPRAPGGFLTTHIEGSVVTFSTEFVDVGVGIMGERQRENGKKSGAEGAGPPAGCSLQQVLEHWRPRTVRRVAPPILAQGQRTSPPKVQARMPPSTPINPQGGPSRATSCATNSSRSVKRHIVAYRLGSRCLPLLWMSQR